MANFTVFEDETKSLEQNLGSEYGQAMLLLLLFWATAKSHYTGCT